MNYRNTLYISIGLTLGNPTLYASQSTYVEYYHKDYPSLPEKYMLITQTTRPDSTSRYEIAYKNGALTTIDKSILTDGRICFSANELIQNDISKPLASAEKRFEEIESIIKSINETKEESNCPITAMYTHKDYPFLPENCISINEKVLTNRTTYTVFMKKNEFQLTIYKVISKNGTITSVGYEQNALFSNIYHPNEDEEQKQFQLIESIIKNIEQEKSQEKSNE